MIGKVFFLITYDNKANSRSKNEIKIKLSKTKRLHCLCLKIILLSKRCAACLEKKMNNPLENYLMNQVLTKVSTNVNLSNQLQRTETSRKLSYLHNM